MSEPQQAKFEGWAVVELMGHQREIGFVTTEAYGTAVMFRIDTPELPEREYTLTRPEYENYETLAAGTKVRREAVPARSRLVAPGSLYAINPCSESAAREALEKLHPRKLAVIERPAKAIEAAQPGPEIDNDEDEDYIEP